ncbi:hypothetical protein [Moorena sp. SIO3I8]|uniref:hypothetical protein n=1 Tax=Moorena sp. SIO3I8 TaxID=2607833 RepID=UPI0013C1F569|nr:hypothetical protein [Moorena sp. SIO3I8]NEO04944.1 hypothetical protein [Moorena sp. SIO3I8]
MNQDSGNTYVEINFFVFFIPMVLHLIRKGCITAICDALSNQLYSGHINSPHNLAAVPPMRSRSVGLCPNR